MYYVDVHEGNALIHSLGYDFLITVDATKLETRNGILAWQKKCTNYARDIIIASACICLKERSFDISCCNQAPYGIIHVIRFKVPMDK